MTIRPYEPRDRVELELITIASGFPNFTDPDDYLNILKFVADDGDGPIAAMTAHVTCEIMIVTDPSVSAYKRGRAIHLLWRKMKAYLVSRGIRDVHGPVHQGFPTLAASFLRTGFELDKRIPLVCDLTKE